MSDDDKPPTLGYYARPVLDLDPSLKKMRYWNSFALVSVIALVVGALTFPLLSLVALVGLAVSIVMTLTYMTIAAAREAGVGYAVRHLILATVLLPFLLLGIFLVPRMVQTDLRNWERASGERK